MHARPFMISVACGLLAMSAGGCSSLLGIDDPHSGQGDDGGMTDGPPPGADHLTLSLTAATIKHSQRVPFRVTAVYPDSTTQDATGSATYESDAPGVAAVGAAGQLEGGAQAGTATITVRFGQARSATIAVTVLDKMCQPVINEFQTAGSTGTTPSANEWIELVNPCARTVDVAGWTLVYRSQNGTADATPAMITLAGSMSAGQLRLYAGGSYTGTVDGTWTAGGTSGQLAEVNGGIALRMGPLDAGALADAVTYGTVSGTHAFTEGAALPAMVRDRPAQRLPYDGRDEDNGPTDFTVVPVGTSGSPGATNVK